MKLIGVLREIEKHQVHRGLDALICIGAALSFVWWFSGEGLFYTDTGPVMSPFTALSLLGMAGARLASKNIETWGHSMSLAILGMVGCGNISNIFMLLTVPEIFQSAMPWTVPTSILTSIGLILFCSYEILIVLRKTPKSYFIVDDILLHLALFPGGLSLLGHLLSSPTYLSSSSDPRVGISLFEMAFMGAFALSSVAANPDLFLWRFLTRSLKNCYIFGALFLNQYVLPTIVGLIFLEGSRPQGIGIEFFVMLAGVLATLAFLTMQAVLYHREY